MNWPRRLSDGSPGAALSIDLVESARLRRERSCVCSKRPSAGEKYQEIFAATAQLAKQEKESFENILALFYSLLTDLLEVSEGRKSSLPRNPDLRREIESLGKKVDWSGFCEPRRVWTRSKAVCGAMLGANWVWTRWPALWESAEPDCEFDIFYTNKLKPIHSSAVNTGSI